MEQISRRELLAYTAVGIAGSLTAASLAGCTAPAKLADTSSDGKPAKAEVPTDGVYVTRALGHESWIYVSTTLRDGAIAACQVVRDNETIGVGNYACARIPAAIVEHQSVNVPNVRGCSISSNAIKTAVTEAIELAGYNIDDFSEEITVEKTNEKIEETCDVVIVGGGTAGLFAAARLAEHGAQVTVVEKRHIPGGSMAMTYGGIISAGSRRQNAYDVTGEFSDTPTGNLDAKMEALRGELLPGNEDSDLSFCRVMYGEAGSMADWLSDIGVGFRTMGTFEGATSVANGLSFAPGMYMGGVGYTMMFLAERIEKFPNAKILYATTATELIKDETGEIVGVKASGENGNEYTIHAKAVCLTGGGFAKNEEMVKKYYPTHAGQFFNCASASTGEVIQMGIDAGGVIDMFGDGELPAYLSSKGLVELAFAGMTSPGLFVNTHGVDLGSCVSHSNTAEMKLDESNGDRFFLVFDSTAAETTRKNLLLGFDTYNCLFERGEAVHYESVAEAAEKLDLPELQAQIDENNGYALSGEPDRFGRAMRPYIETRDGIWCVEVTPTFYLTTDGLRIDEDCHILTEGNEIIPHLYAAGDTAGSIEKKDGLKYSYGFDSASTFGYHMAEVIAKELSL
ncbi:FAD-dependent oxidoreductase [Adlercreutzia sp. R7]|uniref:Urocanate reductase n=1 Tax=Adlercreutzia wanghongyangiae TaxID=3111451 RepID=A0ABU6IKK5_9ACTN|nr:FAD-dependent oxidoreductase [Adlercreutzia sp. R7]